MSAAFVPTFTRYLSERGRAEAWRLGNNVINALLVTTATLAALGMLFAPALVMFFAEDYGDVPGKIELTISLTRIMFPFLTLVAVAVAFMGMLNSLHRFFIPALSPAMFNVGTILCAVVLVPIMPRLGLPGITAIAIGTIVGGLGQVLLQWPLLDREGFRYRPTLDVRDEGLRRILVLMGPGIIGLAAVQINLFVNTMLATREGTGAVSWLQYAFRLMYMPIGLFGVSIATAALPTIAGHAAREELAGMRRTISFGLRMMLMLNVPATLGLVALASPIVALIFERGEFTPADTTATAAALMAYAPGLVGYSTVRIAVPSFYAMHDSRTPVAVSSLAVLLNVALNLTLVRVLGYRGLALGTALAALANAGILLWLLRRRLGGIDGRRLAIAFAKIALASVAMAAAAWGAERWLAGLLPGRALLDQLLRVLGAIAVGLAVLGLTARLLRVQELGDALDLVRSRLTRLKGR